MKKLLYAALPVAAVLAPNVAFAQENGGGMSSNALIPIGVGLTLGLAAFAGAFGQGRAAAAALEGIARNPQAAGKIQVPLIVSLALMEGLTIFSFVVANGMAAKVGQ
jgi:F-type H+-transporting ATPase subunit c